MTRSQYIAEQAAKGRRAVGVFPGQCPKEVLWALDLLPVEIWDPPLTGAAADGHLQPYICKVVKLGLELALSPLAEPLAAFVFPHTCDSVQNLASVVYDYLGLDKPCHFFYHPKAPYGPAAHAYYREQLKTFAAELGQGFGPLDPKRLVWAVELGQRIAALARRVYELRASGLLTVSNAELYRVLRLGEWLWPEDYAAELEGLLARAIDAPQPAPAVVLSGVLPNPPQILTLLDEQGVRVGADDFLALSRRLLAPETAGDDPWQRLTDAYFGLPPCSSKDSPLDQRLAWLRSLAEGCGAQGVIFYVVGFCETELFDLPALAEGLKKAGIPSLNIDVEINQGLTGQIATRVEAFLEMTAQAGPAGALP